MNFEADSIRRMKEMHTITLEECERQAMLLALAHLTVERPGWEYMLTEIAKKMDDVHEGKPRMYTGFLLLRRERVSNSLPDDPTEDSFKKAVGAGSIVNTEPKEPHEHTKTGALA